MVCHKLGFAFKKKSACCRKQHREEIVRLQQQLKSATASTKGGATEAERSKKELEKLRYSKS